MHSHISPAIELFEQSLLKCLCDWTFCLPNIQCSFQLQSCCSLEEHLNNNQRQHPYLLAVGRQKSKIDSFYIPLDKHLIPCQANRSLGAFDELFKAHFVFSLCYDRALVNFYTFLQTTVYNIDVGKMKESLRVRDLRARILNQTVILT